MLRRLIYVLPVLVFVALAAVFMTGLELDPRAVPSGRIDKPVPAFDLPPIEGRDEGLSAADLADGRPVLVNFFASWCVPCLAEHPQLMKMAREEGVRIVGVNYKDRPEDARRWLDRHGDPYAQIGADLDGRTGIEFGISGVPETFVIDGRGHIIAQHIGVLTAEALETRIRPLLREAAE
ncbi:DsbE family thiol:disulfide interchange protein [Tistrella bauzanensis]|jgi:cytochrome c biogenesis protein CcmG/thiol:disulfide interchange protein DsbE|uniref:DsbE family thiol:disulfide interchange protein n=1 Tax=Tistrella arctica TaxID=3133430 RepID=A0ABU9YFH6_9PROT